MFAVKHIFDKKKSPDFYVWTLNEQLKKR